MCILVPVAIIVGACWWNFYLGLILMSMLFVLKAGAKTFIHMTKLLMLLMWRTSVTHSCKWDWPCDRDRHRTGKGTAAGREGSEQRGCIVIEWSWHVLHLKSQWSLTGQRVDEDTELVLRWSGTWSCYCSLWAIQVIYVQSFLLSLKIWYDEMTHFIWPAFEWQCAQCVCKSHWFLAKNIEI